MPWTTRTSWPTIANSHNKSVPSTRPLSPRTTANVYDLAKAYILEPSEAWHQNTSFHDSRNNSVPSPRPLPFKTTANLTDLAQSYLLESSEAWHQNALTNDRRNNSVSLTVAAQNHLNCVHLAQSSILIHNSCSPRRHTDLAQSYLLEPSEAWHQNALTHDRRNNSVSLTVATENHLNCVYLAQSSVLEHDNSCSPRRHTEESTVNASNAIEKWQQTQNQNNLV